MKALRVVVAVCALLALALPLYSQQANSQAPYGMVGRLDLRTGLFTPIGPVPNALTSEEPPPLTTYTGKYVVNFTITISSAIPTTTAIACNVSVTVIDATGQLSDSLAASATRSGSTATCSVTLPYSWLITSSSDAVYVNYDVSAPPQPLVSSSPFPRRYSARPIATTTVPASGATTTYTITTTI